MRTARYVENALIKLIDLVWNLILIKQYLQIIERKNCGKIISLSDNKKQQLLK